jgi:hypothetical protein
MYVVEAAFLELPANWVYGLLITGIPYGWHAGVATALYLENSSSVAVSEYVKVTLPALLLALSGALLSPIIAWLVAQLKAKRKINQTE